MAIIGDANRAERGQILVATESFIGEFDGQEIVVHRGRTRVRAEHPIARRWPGYFKPVDAHFDVEDATAEPGRKRGD